VGQKTHPTGFRTGINKSHASTWFANYGAYSQVLKEDFEIRKLFEKEFEAIYNKAGITKLEILRQINQLELRVYAARPKAITSDNEKQSLVSELKEKLSTLVNDSKQIRI
jgi:small subunit ribosomal protein S3